MIPICDIRGRVIAFGGRILEERKDAPKYINSPENIVYTKGRHLFGLNIAKKEDTKKLIIVEGYMDVISLHQRGVKNVVGALGTALTEGQGWLLRKHAEQIILGFDSDGAGQAAVLRSMEILQNMGCDMRVLQMEGAKDPDEYIIKYGTAGFNKLVENAISLIEYKVKVLKKNLNLDNTIDRIKFLTEIAKLISQVDNTIEKEIYIEKISKEYQISKEAIYAEVNKIAYNNSKGSQILTKQKPVAKRDTLKKVSNISKEVIKRENTIISLLLGKKGKEVYQIINQIIKPEDIVYELNKKIITVLYEQYEKGNYNVNSLIDIFDEELQGQITAIMAEDFGIEDETKAIEDITTIYKRERLNSRKLDILNLLEQSKDEEKRKLEQELSDIIIKLAKLNTSIKNAFRKES